MFNTLITIFVNNTFKFHWTNPDHLFYRLADLTGPGPNN